MTKTVATLLALFMLALVPTRDAVGADFKIGYIIVPRLIAETKAGQAAARDLKAKKDAMQQELDSKLAEIQDFEADVRKRATVLSDEERKRAGEELERQMREAKRLQEDFQRSLQRAEAEVMGRLNRALQAVIHEYGTNGDYDLVFDYSALLHASPAADVTDGVIAAADKAYKPGEGH